MQENSVHSDTTSVDIGGECKGRQLSTSSQRRCPMGTLEVGGATRAKSLSQTPARKIPERAPGSGSMYWEGGLQPLQPQTPPPIQASGAPHT